jgi:hypothetical protein
MSLIAYTITAIERDVADATASGKQVIAGASCSMYIQPADTAVLMYDDAAGSNGNTAKTTGANGQVVVYVEPGTYRLSVNGVDSYVAIGKKDITTQDLIDDNNSYQVGDTVTTTGFTTAGDGGGAQWKLTAATGTASQSPEQLGNALLNDYNGNQWALIPSGAINVKSLGAAGDGVTDDTTVFSAAAKGAVSAKTLTQGRIARADSASVYIPAGEYNITSVVDTGGVQVRWIMSNGALIPNLSVSDEPLDSDSTYDLNPAYLIGSISYEDKRIFLRPCGSRDFNAGFTAQVSGNPQRGSEITGFSDYSSVANYADRDAVGIYSDAYADPNEQILIDPVTSYTETRVDLPVPLTSAQIARLRVGMMIDTRHTGAKFTGHISDWDDSGNWIDVEGWYAIGDTSDGQIPSGTTGILINPVTKVWGMNTQIKIPTTSYAHAGSGMEIGISDWKAESERFETGRDIAVDNSPHYVWGLHITNFTSNKMQAHLVLDGPSWYAIQTNANVSNGFRYRGGGSALISQNDSLTTRCRILNSGRYFLEEQTATVTATPDENPDNSFYWDSALKFNTASGPTIELGRQYDASTPAINFHQSGGNINYDTRIRSTNGDGATDGDGYLWLEADGGSGRVYLDADDVIVNGATRLRPADNNATKNGDTGNRWSETYSVEFRPGTVGDVVWTNGTGDPEGVVTAPVGSMFTRRDGGATSTLYVKESGTGNMGWIPK